MKQDVTGQAAAEPRLGQRWGGGSTVAPGGHRLQLSVKIWGQCFNHIVGFTLILSLSVSVSPSSDGEIPGSPVYLLGQYLRKHLTCLPPPPLCRSCLCLLRPGTPHGGPSPACWCSHSPTRPPCPQSGRCLPSPTHVPIRPLVPAQDDSLGLVCFHPCHQVHDGAFSGYKLHHSVLRNGIDFF